MKEERHAYNAELRVNPEGGYIERYVVRGRDILFYDVIDGKKRGTHVCLPNFGPDESGQLAQHGFGRTATWQAEQSDDESVLLSYRHGKDDAWQGLFASLEYRLLEGGLRTTLDCRNESDTAQRLAPGLHPYFCVTEKDTPLNIEGESFDISLLGETQYRDFGNRSVKAAIGAQLLTLQSNNLPLYALWSAHADKYVCIEPTFGGNRFLALASNDEWLAPGEKRSFEWILLLPSLLDAETLNERSAT